MSLTEEQSKIVQADWAAKLLVTAGPGTGKTHTLIARLSELIRTHELNAAEEILVLSFSRAAVREIRNRTAAAGRDLRGIRAQTFDSFATALLSEFAPDESWITEGYDGRIRRATCLLHDDKTTRQRITDYKHVLVDEVQDLVGERADFVKTILDVSTGGFTLLGDPAQGIYNFQLKDPQARRIGSAALYRWLRARYNSSLNECALTVNHRAQSEIAQRALWAGAELNALEPDYESIKKKLDSLVWQLTPIGDLQNPQHLASMLKVGNVPTAILCWDNGQALMISRQLHEVGLPHLLQRSATDRALPSWIGTLFAELEQKQISRTLLLQRIEALLGNAFEPQECWRLLKRTERRSGDFLDASVLSERIQTGNVPDDLIEPPRENIVVSTIWRAKGLEFDRVVLISPRRENVENVENVEVVLPEQTRSLYVALTRPKRDLKYLETPGFKGLMLHRETERWTRRFGRNFCKVCDVEMRGEDVHKEDPAGTWKLKDCNTKEIQIYIRSHVKRGDEVVLNRLDVAADAAPPVYYDIRHNGQPVGVTCEQFGWTLYKILKISRTWEVKWPERIDGLRVEAVDTVAGIEASGRRGGLGICGLWLRVRVAGLGKLWY